MSSTDEARWKQRLASFGLALSQLDEACAQDSYSNLERAGLVKTFEFCFELSWNVLKDLLFYEGYEEKGPRSAIRRSFEIEYIDERDCELFLEALEKRNILSHAYRKSAAVEAETLIRDRYHPVLVRLHATLRAKANR